MTTRYLIIYLGIYTAVSMVVISLAFFTSVAIITCINHYAYGLGWQVAWFSAGGPQ